MTFVRVVNMHTSTHHIYEYVQPGMRFLTLGGFIRFKRLKRLKLCFKSIIANYNFLK